MFSRLALIPAASGRGFPARYIKATVGGIGLLAAILSAVQTLYSHARRAEEHRTAAAQLGQVRREIEILEQFPPSDEEELK